jgi:hypothetical protein
MAKVKETAARAVGRAKAAVSRAKRKGGQLATKVAKKKAVRQARKSVARVRNQTVAVARKMTDKVTGRARKRLACRRARSSTST